MEEGPATLRHIVLFKYRASTSPSETEQVTDAFRALQHLIPGVESFEHGVNTSPENKAHGFTHIYTLTFASADARDTYLPHPAHEAFGALLHQLDILEDVLVVDYVPLP